MSVNIEYANANFPEVINNYNSQTGTLSSITLIAYNSEAINVNDLVNLVITGGSFAVGAGTPIPATTLNGMARVISKVAYGKDNQEYIRLEFNPAKSMPGLVVPIEPVITINGTITRLSNISGNTTAPYPAAFSNITTVPYPAPAPAFYNSNIAFSPALAPASSYQIPEQLTRIIPSSYNSFFQSLNQSEFNRVTNLYSTLMNITDTSGDSIGRILYVIQMSSSYLEPSDLILEQKYRPKEYILMTILCYILCSIFKERFTNFLINTLNISQSQELTNFVQPFYLLNTDSEIVEFIRMTIHNIENINLSNFISRFATFINIIVSREPAAAPAQAPIIPTIVTDSASMMGPQNEPMFLNLFNRLNQSIIDRIAILLTTIYDVTDSSGNKFGDAFAYNDISGVRVYINSEFRNTYKRVLGFAILNQLFVFILGIRFIEIATNGNATISSLPTHIQVFYNLCAQINNDTNKILQFYRQIFNRKDELLNTLGSSETAIPILSNIIMNILNSSPAPAPTSVSAPPAPRNNSNSTNSRLANITRDLDYLRSLGLSATSDNETMKKTLRNYKNVTGSDYVFPPAAARSREELEKELQYLRSVGFTANSDNETMKKTLRNYKNVTGSDYVFPSLSREELEKELQYLFGLGLTPDSGNDTMNDRLAKWRELTGEDYVYNPSGGKYRRKSVKRRGSKKSKTRKQ